MCLLGVMTYFSIFDFAATIALLTLMADDIISVNVVVNDFLYCYRRQISQSMLWTRFHEAV